MKSLDSEVRRNARSRTRSRVRTTFHHSVSDEMPRCLTNTRNVNRLGWHFYSVCTFNC